MQTEPVRTIKQMPQLATPAAARTFASQRRTYKGLSTTVNSGLPHLRTQALRLSRRIMGVNSRGLRDRVRRLFWLATRRFVIFRLTLLYGLRVKLISVRPQLRFTLPLMP